MISLFSTFDLFYFYWQFVTIFFFLGVLLVGYWPCTFFKALNWATMNFIKEFFSSLLDGNSPKSLVSILFAFLVFIFLMNFSSIFPFNFPLFSQLSIVLLLSGGLWASVVLFGFMKNFKNPVSHYTPEGGPLLMSPFLFTIEVVSSVIRPLTLTIRLLANIVAGHLLVSLLCGLVSKFWWAVPSLSFLNIVESAVSIIQSYIYSTLLVLYATEV